jgi:hypothetical protein
LERKNQRNGNKLVLSLIKRDNLIKLQRAELEDFKGQMLIDQAFERSNKINLLAKAVFLLMTMLN